MTLSDEQIQELLRVGNPTNEECRLIRMGWDAAIAGMRPKSVPDGWLRAIDEALVTAHIGVANAHDTYEQAKAKLDNLIRFHVDVATDPAVNGGFKLMLDGWEANLLIVEHAMRMNNWDWNSNTSDDLKRSAYKIISNLLAAPEAK